MNPPIDLSELTQIEYIGDGAYVGFDNLGTLWIITSDGIKTTNAICLEDVVLTVFINYLAKHGKVEQ